MPTVDWLKKEFDYGYSSGNVLAIQPDAHRLKEERVIGGSYRRFFLEGVLPFLKPGMHVVELGPGNGSWTRALLSVPDIRVTTCDFQDVTKWLKPECYDGRLVCHRVTDNSFSCIADNSVDVFFSFGVLVHCNKNLIAEILKNILGKMKHDGVAIHNFGDWNKLEKFGWELAGIPLSFKDLPDDDIWWPRNTTQEMNELAESSGWITCVNDMHFFKRDGVALLAKKEDVPEAAKPLACRKMSDLIAPVAFFTFNRPEHTRRTLAALAANDLAADTDLHIFCDGPRSKTDEEAVVKVREICRAASGFASLHVHEKSVNQGLAKSLITGISSLFEKHEQVIVFEDDVLASIGTLRFLNTCLDQYHADHVVFNISAWSPDPQKIGFPDNYPWDVYFIPRFNCWGWATWKDRWQSIDWNLSNASALFNIPRALNAYSQGGTDVPHMLRACLDKRNDSWAVRADFARFTHGRLGLNPIRAYVDNIGCDNTGTHCGESPQYAVNTSLAPATIRFPEYIFVDDVLGAGYRKFFSGDNGSSVQKLMYHRNSKIVQGTLQLRDIAKRRAWHELVEWNRRAARYMERKLFRRTRRTPATFSLNAAKRALASADPFDAAKRAFAEGDLDIAFYVANALKGKVPIPGLDALRADIFMLKGDIASSVQALREELRYFPDNVSAQEQLRSLVSQEGTHCSDDPELDSLLSLIAPYTMVGLGRLYALHANAKRICSSSLQGNFVECGVAAGGTSGLLSAILLQHDHTKARRLFSFDTFAGMPKPTQEDTCHGITAQDSGWGEGTCAAPLETLTTLLQSLGTVHLVQPVQGFFADTLPNTKETIGSIAFLHMDGDWYESTRDILMNLYDQLVPGAYVQVDDYGHWEGCRKALHEFFAKRGIDVKLHTIDGTGVWFNKPESVAHSKKDFYSVSDTVNAKRQSGSAVMVNLGCGSRWHSDWINIDFHGDNTNVFQHNLRKGLPLPDTSADCIYAGHCLEHFTPHDAEQFLRECARVLKPSGLLRIVVPDLEQAVRAYLVALDAARATADTEEVALRHEWMIIELVDQLCRHQSGGEMLKLWARSKVPAEDFIISRIGTEYLNARKRCKGMKPPPYSTDPLQVGTFRLGGEPHQWMYDELSLSRFLRRCDFVDVKRMNAVSSRLNNFARYCLDTNKDGTLYKPDSLYLEAFLR